MRLFLGIELPTQIKSNIAAKLLPLQTSGKGWENPLDYHLTLLFIGEVGSQKISDISTRMQKISFSPFELTLNGLRFFNRRILYLDFAASVELIALKDQVENEFSEWLTPHRKPFVAHVTIKRWQRYEYEDLQKNIEKNKFGCETFTVKELALFKSEKDEHGQKYHVIASHKAEQKK